MKTIVRILIGIIAIAMIGYIVVLKWPKATVKSKAVDIEISAQDIYNEYSSNETSAQRKYFGKVVQVSGIIDEVYEDEDGAPVVILIGTDGDPTAVITLASDQSDEIANYKEGDTIKVKAQCSGMLMEVTFSKGIVI